MKTRLPLVAGILLTVAVTGCATMLKTFRSFEGYTPDEMTFLDQHDAAQQEAAQVNFDVPLVQMMLVNHTGHVIKEFHTTPTGLGNRAVAPGRTNEYINSSGDRLGVNVIADGDSYGFTEYANKMAWFGCEFILEVTDDRNVTSDSPKLNLCDAHTVTMTMGEDNHVVFTTSP